MGVHLLQTGLVWISLVILGGWLPPLSRCPIFCIPVRDIAQETQTHEFSFREFFLYGTSHRIRVLGGASSPVPILSQNNTVLQDTKYGIFFTYFVLM